MMGYMSCVTGRQLQAEKLNAQQKLLIGGFAKDSDSEFVKNDWTVRFFVEQFEAFNNKYYFREDLTNIDMDDVISDINGFIEKDN